GVLPDAEHPLDLAVGHGREAGDVGVIAQDLRVPVVAEVVFRGRGAAIHRLQIGDEELGQVTAVAGVTRLSSYGVAQRVVRPQRRWGVHVPVHAYVQGRRRRG